MAGSAPADFPSSRIRALNELACNPAGELVVYWMTTARRLRWNFALQQAVARCLEFGKPLVILEALRCDYPYASDRLHGFVLDGMADNLRGTKRSKALYHPFVERAKRGGAGLIEALSKHACVIVADWYPAFFVPRMLQAAAGQAAVRLEAVDSNGLIPLASHGRAFPMAHSYRSFVHRTLPDHLGQLPAERPLSLLRKVPRCERLPDGIAKKWPAVTERELKEGRFLGRLPIDHAVPRASLRGGERAARRALREFVHTRLGDYAEARNHPDDDATSRLSPYLHFGHISAHEVFNAIMTRERWTTRKLSPKKKGAREGWWGVSRSAEAFLDQLVVWRELSFNGCEYIDDYTSYSSLPDWARRTLDEHRSDRRPHRYSLGALDAAKTHDELWNAAQRQLAGEGWFHNYLRMLWGKKILEWCRNPADALTRMRQLMDRYSLDGRDPNSYAGYAWVLGRYDRPWPERPIFGSIRYMTSESARRKLRLKKFLERYGGAET